MWRRRGVCDDASVGATETSLSRPTRSAAAGRNGARRDEPLGQVLVLTAAIGGGHVSVARALSRLFRSQGASVVVRSPIAEVRTLRRLPGLYCILTSQFRWLWAIYYYARKLRPIRQLNAHLVRTRLGPRLLSMPELDDCDTVVVTNSLYCHCLRTLAEHRRTIVVVTDLFGGPDEWFLPGADQYVVPSPAMRDAAIRNHVPPHRILERRLEILKVPGANNMPRVRCGNRHAISGVIRILIAGGSGGVGPLRAIAEGMLDSSLPVDVTVACGTNDKLACRIRGMRRNNLHALSFDPRLSRRLADFDLVVTKPGSVSLMEVIGCDALLLLAPGIPGVERANTVTLVSHHGIPFVSCARSSRNAIRSLFNPDLSLTGTALASKENQEKLRDGQALSAERLQLTDLFETTPEPRKVASLERAG